MVRDNLHIDADSPIRDDRKWLRFCVLARPPLRDENIIARRQRRTIVSIFIRNHPRDFFLFVPAQDEQWLVSIVCRRERRCLFIADINRPGRKDLQMSF